jgi:hypothetical protein
MKKFVEEKNETYRKIKLAARMIASIPNLSEVIVVCAK